MLLPALNRARDCARAVSCLNNQRQLGGLCSLYADSLGEGRIPVQIGDYTWAYVVQTSSKADRAFFSCPGRDIIRTNSWYWFSYGIDKGKTEPSAWGDPAYTGRMGDYYDLRMIGGKLHIFHIQNRIKHPSQAVYIADTVKL